MQYWLGVTMQTGKYNKKFTASYQSTDGENWFLGPKAFPLTVPKTLAFGHDASDTGSILFVPGVVFAIQDQGENGAAGAASSLISAQFPTYNAAIMATTYPGLVFGTNKYISVADSAVLDYASTGMCYIGVWQLNALPTTFKNIVGKSGIASNFEFAVAILSTGEVVVTITDDGSTANQMSTGFIAQVNEPFIIELDFNTVDFMCSINGANHVYAAQTVFNGTSPFFYGDATKDGTVAMAESYFYTKSLTASEKVGDRTWLAEKYNITVADAPAIPTMLLTGQSNALGLAGFLEQGVPPAYYLAPMTNAYIYRISTAQTEALQGGVSNQGFNATFFGPEMPCAANMNTHFGRRFMIIKKAQGDSYLASTPMDTTQSHYPEEGDQWFATLDAIDDAFAYERSQGRNIEIFVDVWNQGESDMTVEARALAYEDNLVLYVPTIRTYMHTRGYASETVRFIATGPGVQNATYLTYKAVVKAGMQAAVAQLPNCLYIDAEPFALKVDETHLSAIGMIAYGDAVSLLMLP